MTALLCCAGLFSKPVHRQGRGVQVERLTSAWGWRWDKIISAPESHRAPVTLQLLGTDAFCFRACTYGAITECFQKLNLGVEECCALIKPLNPCVSLLQVPGIASAFKLLLLPWHLWCWRWQRGTESEMRTGLG